MKTAVPAVTGRVVLLCLVLFARFTSSFGQTSSKSMLINHGGNCGTASGEQQFITGATSATPKLVGSGTAGMPYYNLLAAYDPEDQKVYYAKMDASHTYIYAADYNFDGVLTYPNLATPTYTYNYPINQLCFDNNGDNYTFSSFDASKGKVTLNRVDIATGNEIGGTNKQVIFPYDNIPNTLGDGDVVVLPNGRVFATFGNSPSKLFEINNSDGPGKGSVTFLANLPRVCFAIAYVDGNLMVAGSDGGGCYYYTWDINSFTLSQANTFPFGKSSADMSSFTAGLGVANRLLGSAILGSNSAFLSYEIVLKNKGNIDMSNLLLTDNLKRTFGTTAISNVSLYAVSNPAGLKLNANFNGVSDTNLLALGQTLHNFPLMSDSVILRVQFTVSNLTAGTVYNNSILTTGWIGSGSDFLVVSDSSNNGDASRIDIDRNGVSDDLGENVPTPFVFASVLAISNLDLKATKTGNAIHLAWQGLADEATAYNVERSHDGVTFQPVTTLQATAKNSYAFVDDISTLLQKAVYYRINAVKPNLQTVYSNLVILKNISMQALSVSLFPNPAHSQVTLQTYFPAKAGGTITVLDISGKVIVKQTYTAEAGNHTFSLDGFSKATPGIYWVRLSTETEQRMIKLVKQ